MAPGRERRLSRRKFLVTTGQVTAASLIAAACNDGTSAPTAAPVQPAAPLAPPTNTPRPAEAATAALAECINTPQAEQQKASEAFDAFYPEWKRKYVTAEGTQASDQLRVKRLQSDVPEGWPADDTVSEGMGYGMMLALHADDADTFHKMRNYAKHYTNPNGMMNWRVKPDGTAEDPYSGTTGSSVGAATDGDLDRAYALLAAAKKWNNEEYKEEAIALITNIMDHAVDDQFVIRPGDMWGGADQMNTSFIAPGYFEAFFQATQDQRWKEVAKKQREIIDNVYRERNIQTGLMPTYTQADGKELPREKYAAGPEGDAAHAGENKKFGWDSIRLPLRQIKALLWYCDDPEIAGHAFEVLKRVNATLERHGPEGISAGYDIQTGESIEDYTDLAFVSMAAVASMVSQNEAYRNALLEKTANWGESNYYNDSLRALALLALGKRLEKPE